jgi:peptidoglycan L-alanyl-D-glutamate endopeptidase CwlK
MPRFSQESIKKLDDCNINLQLVLLAAIKVFDFKIIETSRSYERQKSLVTQGLSKTMKSKHLIQPAEAADIYPYPIAKNLNDPEYLKRFFFLAGVMLTCAHDLGIKIRWGCDWNQNMIFNDQSFTDMPHFELV